MPPEQASFPPEERSTYTAAAVILAADALAGVSATARPFADHSFPPALLDIDPVDEPPRP